jgi:MFS family permease
MMIVEQASCPAFSSIRSLYLASTLTTEALMDRLRRSTSRLSVSAFLAFRYRSITSAEWSRDIYELTNLCQISAAIGALLAGRLGDIIGRKRCVRIGAFIYFFTAFMQMFASGFDLFVAGRTLQGLGVRLSNTAPHPMCQIVCLRPPLIYFLWCYRSAFFQ